MGKQTLKQRILEFIGGIGWDLFIWANYDGSENRYFKAIEFDILTRNGIKVCIVCGEKGHETCDNYPF